MTLDVDKIRSYAKAVRGAINEARLQALVVQHALSVQRGLEALGNWDTRAAARHFAHAAVLQSVVEELQRCDIHGERRPCVECQGLSRLQESGEVP